MRIQYKLSITFVLLLVFGVTAISSYSIVFIRGYLMNQAEEGIQADAEQLLTTLQLMKGSQNGLSEVLHTIGKTSPYDIRIFDERGQFIDASFTSSGLASARPGAALPDSSRQRLAQLGSDDETPYTRLFYTLNEEDNPRVFVFGKLPEAVTGALYYIEISRLKEDIYRPVRTIRWIIYSGMFISIAIILFVSFLFSEYLARPILALKNASQRIAEGDTKQQIHLDRTDEFGMLADSLNRMAARLQRDNEQLVKAAEKQKQFYADIAHEIRNPLHTISGTLEMLQLEGLPEEKRKKFLDSARNQAERLNRLFKDLMTLQRSDMQRAFLHKKHVRLRPLVENVAAAFREMAEARGLDFRISGPDVRVYADPGKLEQVFDNLISNALKYTPQGHIEIAWRKDHEDPHWLHCSVSDTGIGIPPQHISKLFDRFYRTDKARSRDKGGAGLGLS
ncbi:MAG: sensor histidine kinase, partial [Cyclonatronaceae bacterium]